MKNVYARFSYATMRNEQVYDPYVQLMPITDIEDAHHDWETWYTKWGGSSSQPSSTPAVHPTPSSSISTPPSHSFPLSSLVSSSSSASSPLATGGNNQLSGAVEDDDTEEEPDSVRSFLFFPLTSACLTYLSDQTALACHHSWLDPWWSCSYRRNCLRRDEEAKRS